MQNTAFRSTVSAIVYSILHERFPPRGPGEEFPHNRAVRFVLEQHGRMPDYLRLPLMVVTLVFDWSSIPLHGRRFHKMQPSKRSKKIQAWRNSPLSPCRDFIRFYDSLAVYYWYSKVGLKVPKDRAHVDASTVRTVA